MYAIANTGIFSDSYASFQSDSVGDAQKQLNQPAFELFNQGKFNEAIEIAEQVLIIIQSLYPGDHPDMATSLNNLAALYNSQGRYTEAEPLYTLTVMGIKQPPKSDRRQS
ncbi:tetratricopeptide repeat protein [Planktothrix mougeotii]|uniref:Tetratricopeptide repeat protein n=1 Tax=Planktothrix mougeotii LEGE 06226 TaxID=1828728 RepID=A0ABR9U5V0_9CYAN|nr:tetratricopeptide repeat protein [Planktothrix mougeotii]MBE9141807.1 tetratricopeptide repeat protein [Planktothrix mougeotii LEGE 06226]